jgi:hypothetical protein
MNFGHFCATWSFQLERNDCKRPTKPICFVSAGASRGVHEWNRHPMFADGVPDSLASNSCAGTISYAAFDSLRATQPDCVFLRKTDITENWQYQWTGLPFECERLNQKELVSGETDSRGQSEWMGSRLRAITFGHNASFVVYTGAHLKWSDELPFEVDEVLQQGNDERWSINVSQKPFCSTASDRILNRTVVPTLKTQTNIFLRSTR